MENLPMRASYFLLATALIVSLPIPIEAAYVCLSYRDARTLFPRIHLFWYRDKQTGDKCWSNLRRGPPRGLKFDPVFSKAHAEDTQEKRPDRKGRAVIKIVKPQDYNELDAEADRDLFFNAKPVPFWRFSALDDGFDTWRRRVEDLLK